MAPTAEIAIQAAFIHSRMDESFFIPKSLNEDNSVGSVSCLD